MAIPVGLVILAASAALKYANDQDALRRQKKLADAMEAFQRRKSGESMAATEELVKKQTPEARGTELADVTRAREQSLRDSVGAAQAFDAPDIAGKVSGDYRAASEADASRRAEKLRRAIEQLATMGAPGEQQLKHSLRFGKAAGTVDAANLASENVGRTYRSAISNTRSDPFVDMVSQIGMGVGGGMLGGAGAATAPAGAAAMGANPDDPYSGGHFTYEDSAGNTQSSAIPYKVKRGFSLWGRG